MEAFQNTWINIHTHHPTGEGVEIINLFPEDKNKLDIPGYYSIGLHPWRIKDDGQDQFKIIGDNAKNNAVYAIGETGLDKLISTPFDLQIEIFRLHINLAEELQKPLIIHCVKAFNELVQVKKEMAPTSSWILHGFNNNLQIADMLIRHEIYLSFGKALLNPQSNAVKVLPQLNDEVYLLETDDGNISIKDIYKSASGLVDLDIEKMKDLMYLNFTNCFRI